MAPKNFPQEMNKFKEIIFVFITCIAFSQNNRHLFSGTIRNITGNELPFATILIENTTLGTTSDTNGKFNILLPNGTYTFIFRYLGYKSFSLTLELSCDTTVVISLLPAEICLPEILVSGEDPAYPIIREALRKKKKWKSLIESYKARVYTKDTFGNDSLLALISEAYSDLYYRRNDSLREVVIHRRQSSNMPDEFQLAIVRDFLDFTNDTIRHWGYSFVTPLAESAFQLYDFRLLRTFKEEGQLFYEIQVIPRSDLQPLFSGTITIADSSYALQKVKLSPNTIFTIPLFSITRFEFSQQFMLYEKQFWLPLEYHLSAEMKFHLFGVMKTKPLYYNKSVICYEYFINAPFADSIHSLPSLSILPTARSDDTLFWKNTKVYPLTPLEETSYKKIDEIVKNRPAIFRFSGFLSQYRELLKSVDIHYNRVEGLFLGGRYAQPIKPDINLKLGAGYGLADKKFKYYVGADLALDSYQSLSLGAENYQWNQTLPLNYSYTELINTFAAFFSADDYYNYYFVRGNRFYLSYGDPVNVMATVSLLAERHFSLQNTTNFSLRSLTKKVSFRPNPLCTEGRITSIVFESTMGENIDDRVVRESHTAFRLRIERSFTELGSNANFTSLFSAVLFRVPTMGTTRLFNPYLGISVSGGSSFGVTPIQRTFALETSLAGYTNQFAFRTVGNTEFSGDKFYTLSLEHNFRNIPFILHGMNFLNIDFSLKFATSKVWVTTTNLRNVLHPTQGNLNEYSLGIGRLIDIFQIELTHSDYQTSRYAVTFSGSW